MDVIVNFGNYLTSAILVIAGGVAVVMFLLAGYLWMFTGGDPARVAKAKSATLAVFVGMLIAGAAFMLPRVVVTQIIEPSGGRIEGIDEAGEVLRNPNPVDCDQVLRDRLDLWEGPANHRQLSNLVDVIKARVPGCEPGRWSLRIARKAVGSGNADWAGAAYRACFQSFVSSGGFVYYRIRGVSGAKATVLFTEGGDNIGGHPVRRSGIGGPFYSTLLYFDGDRQWWTGNPEGLPASGASCWYKTGWGGDQGQWVEGEPMPRRVAPPP